MGIVIFINLKVRVKKGLNPVTHLDDVQQQQKQELDASVKLLLVAQGAGNISMPEGKNIIHF